MTCVTRHAIGTVALAGAALLAAACGPKAGSAAADGTESPSSAPMSTAPVSPGGPSSGGQASGSTASGCASTALKAKVDVSAGGAAAGSTYVPIDFTNTSGSPCTMFGYPGVSFVASPAGGQLGKAASRNAAAVATTVTLAPGGVAHATLQVAQAGNYSQSACKTVTAHWLKIFPPDQITAIYARYTVQACSARLPRKLGSQLAVYVVRPGPGRAGQAP